MMHGAAWAAYHDRVAATERSQGNPTGAAFYQREANRTRHSLSQLRGHSAREGQARSSLARSAPCAGSDLFAASGLVEQRAGNREANGLRCCVESVPVHAASNATEMGAVS